MRTTLAWFAAALLLLAAGCATSGNSAPDPGDDAMGESNMHAPTPAARAAGGDVSEDSFRVFRGDYEVSQELKNDPPTSVAVLPFTEEGEWSVAPDGLSPREIVRRGMYNHLAYLPFRDLEPSRVDARLAVEGLTDPNQLSELVHTDPERLRRILGVDAVVLGTVTHFDRVYLGVYSEVRVGCDIRMVSLRTGAQLWRAEHQSASTSAGASIDPIGIALTALSTLWNLREDEFYTQTDDLFREIASTLERELDPALVADGPPPPSIDLFTCLNPGKPFAAGESIAFRLVGEPGCLASVVMEGREPIALNPVSDEVKAEIWDQTLAMVREHYVETGHVPTPEMLEAIRTQFMTRQIYQGEYVVVPGEEEAGLTATAYLEEPGGSRAEALYADQPIAIDTRAPAAPVNVAEQDSDAGPVLVWTANQEADVVGYEVHGSDSPLEEPRPLAVVEANQVRLQDLPAHDVSYFRVRAVDRAGNRSPFSIANAAATPVLAAPVNVASISRSAPLSDATAADIPPQAPSELGGALDQDLHLTAASGPYTVAQDLVVTAGRTLTLDPGVTLLMRPGATLRVEGGTLAALGTEAAPVRIVPEQPGAAPGSHGGVELVNPASAELRFVSIEYATTGVTLRNGRATLESVRIAHSSQAGLLLGQGSRPVLEHCRIEDNQGMGGLVVEGNDVAPLMRDNDFVNNAPFQVQSYTDAQLDLRGNRWGTADPPMEWFLGNVLLEEPGSVNASQGTAL